MLEKQGGEMGGQECRSEDTKRSAMFILNSGGVGCMDAGVNY